MGNNYKNSLGLVPGLSACFAVACLLTLSCSFQSATAQSADPLSTKFIADDAMLIIALQPSKIAALGEKDSETNKYVLEQMKKQTGVDVEKLDQMVVQFGVTDAEETDDPGDALAIIFHFREKIDVESIVEKMGSSFNLTKGEMNGRPIYTPESDSNPALYFADDKTMIMGLEKRVKKCASASGMGDAGKLAKTITSADHIGIAFGGADSDDKKRVMGEVLQEMPLSQMGIDEEMITKVKSGEIHINLKDKKMMAGKLVCADGDTAGKVVDAGKEAVENMVTSLEDMESQLAQAPPEILEIAEPMIELAYKTLENVKLTSDQSTVNINVEVEGGASKIVDGIGKALEQTFRMLERFGG